MCFCDARLILIAPFRVSEHSKYRVRTVFLLLRTQEEFGKLKQTAKNPWQNRQKWKVENPQQLKCETFLFKRAFCLDAVSNSWFRSLIVYCVFQYLSTKGWFWCYWGGKHGLGPRLSKYFNIFIKMKVWKATKGIYRLRFLKNCICFYCV